jgi:hypothetical protein
LKRYHRAARRDRAEKHLVSRSKTRAISPATIERGLVAPEPSGRRPQQREDEKEGLELVDLVKPPALEIVLGQGRLDPFNVYPTENVSTYVHEVLDHGALQKSLRLYLCLRTYAALNYTWPRVSPFGRPATNPVKRAWMGMAMANPVSFYSFVFAAALHHAYEHDWVIPTSASKLILSYKTKAISLVNDAIQTIDVEISEALLVSILILAAHGPRAITGESETSTAEAVSPLAKTQNIEFYSRLGFDSMHINALRVLVKRRGGLSSIQTYGLGETIA